MSAVLLVAVLVMALVVSSSGEAPESGNEDELVSGVASDFMVNENDIGAIWTVSPYIPDSIDNPEVTSYSFSGFEQLNSSGDVHYRVEIAIAVFNSVDNASAFIDKCIETHIKDSSGLEPGTSPYPVFLTNVSIGDRGGILFGPGITPWNEVKWLLFVDKNVVCSIRYHDMTSYDPLPNELLIDLANKVESRIK